MNMECDELETKNVHNNNNNERSMIKDATHIDNCICGTNPTIRKHTTVAASTSPPPSLSSSSSSLNYKERGWYESWEG
jgi:hypothetical protein